MRTVADLKKELEKFSDDALLLFTLGDEDEVCVPTTLYEGDNKQAWFYLMMGKPEDHEYAG